MNTVNAQLVAKEHDILGYITYVFKVLEDAPFGHKYVMCVRPPNWQHRNIDIEEKGFLTYKEVQAGDNWYDFYEGKYIPYKYTNIYFIKFVKKVDSYDKNITI